MGYAEDWNAAKQTFEEKTELKKPGAKGTFLFISWRKPSGIEDALKDIDKFIAGVKDWTAADMNTFKRWDGLNKTLNQKMVAYLKTLGESIKKEKEEAGKTDQYRHLKVLKTSLETIVAKIEQQHKFQLESWKVRQAKGSKAMDRIDVVLTTLRQLGNNLKAGVAQASQFCKEVLAEPTPANWNKINSDNGARRLSQPLTNICKYVYADYADLLVKGNDKELAVLDDERVIEQIRKLNIYLFNLERDIRALGDVSGTSAMDGSVAFLADKIQGHLPPEASKEDVIRAVKRFAGMVKKCSEISAELIRFGT